MHIAIIQFGNKAMGYDADHPDRRKDFSMAVAALADKDLNFNVTHDEIEAEQLWSLLDADQRASVAAQIVGLNVEPVQPADLEDPASDDSIVDAVVVDDTTDDD